MTKYTDTQRHEAVDAALKAVEQRPIDWHTTDEAMQRLMETTGVTPFDVFDVLSTRSLLSWFPSWAKTTASKHTPVVYFIATHDRRYVKIGTTRRLVSRLGQIQSSHPEPIHLLGIAVGSYDVERRWHEQWKHLRARGEWFTLTPGLQACIDEDDTVRHLTDTLNPKDTA